MILEVMKLTKELLGGEEYAMSAYALPHFPRAGKYLICYLSVVFMVESMFVLISYQDLL